MKKFKTILYYVCALGVLAMIVDAVIMSIFGADALCVQAVANRAPSIHRLVKKEVASWEKEEAFLITGSPGLP